MSVYADIFDVVQGILGSKLVDTGDVAHALGTSPRSVQRWAARQAVPHRTAEERLLELAAVLELAAQTLPADDAPYWMRRPIADLDWRKPLEVIKEGGFRQVIGALGE